MIVGHIVIGELWMFLYYRVRNKECQSFLSVDMYVKTKKMSPVKVT